ncbi:hypothetical protein PSR1_00901 [Anaeromyxobacter sp. PSR-1]|nr:hypothetical protein PSR1_00901 [Anaeromyxobacter sp. PSR-1]
MRRAGSRSAIAANVAALPSPATASQISVSTQPGESAFTRSGASSSAAARTNAASAPFTAAIIEPRGMGRSAAIPVVNVSEPPGRSAGAPCFASSSAPSSFESTTARAASRSKAAMGW